MHKQNSQGMMDLQSVAETDPSFEIGISEKVVARQMCGFGSLQKQVTICKLLT